MPAKAVGLADLTSYLGDLAAGLAPKVVASGLRAGAKVIADEARAECRSEEVRETIGVVGRSETGIAVAKVQTAGPGAYKAPWLEFGTDPHLIQVHEEDRVAVSTANRAARRSSLVIGGHFVGPVIEHPGANPFPFLRPAADRRIDDAVTAMRDEIARRATPRGLAEPAPKQDADQ
jgi:hypothetical protein